MKLKHLSLNTEKVYTVWNRQFQEFVNGKSSNVRFGGTDNFSNLPWERRFCACHHLNLLSARRPRSDHIETSDHSRQVIIYLREENPLTGKMEAVF